MEKQNVTYPYDEFGNKKKWSTDVYYNIDEPSWKHDK
jgi:hypothetical protein